MFYYIVIAKEADNTAMAFCCFTSLELSKLSFEVRRQVIRAFLWKHGIVFDAKDTKVFQCSSVDNMKQRYRLLGELSAPIQECPVIQSWHQERL